MKSSDIAVPQQVILLLGSTGSGKSAQITTLPGKKLVYVMEPNAMATLRGRGRNLDILDFSSENEDLELRLKGFNKDSSTDRKGTPPEPKLYTRWEEDFGARRRANFFDDYDWVCLDSGTFMAQAMLERQMYLNKRTGEPPDQGDYRVVGDAFRRVFQSLVNTKRNVLMTGHLSEYETDSKRLIIQAFLPGSARQIIPLACTNVWLAQLNATNNSGYTIRTLPEPYGLRDIRTSVPNLKETERVDITNFTDPEQYGIGGLLRKAGINTILPRIAVNGITSAGVVQPIVVS